MSLIRVENVDLLSLLPQRHANGKIYFKDILDFKEIMKTEQIELSSLYGFMEQVSNNIYILTADQTTLEYHESLLQIILEEGDTLEIRRNRIISRYRRRPPFTLPVLKETLNDLVGIGLWSINIDYDALTMVVTINRGEAGINSEVAGTLIALVPAHIGQTIKQELLPEIETEIYIGATMTVASGVSFIVPPLPETVVTPDFPFGLGLGKDDF